MTLTLEQFAELRRRNVSMEQIATFESGQKPQDTARYQFGQTSKYRQLANTISDFSTGFVKGGFSTLRGVGKIGEGFLKKTGLGSVVDKNSIYSDVSKKGKRATELLTPQNTAEKVGFGAEKVAEFLMPSAQAARAERVVQTLSEGITHRGLAALSRIVGKSAVQGASAGAVTFVQTGGDIEESKKVALTAGLARGALAIIGEGARALKIPERLYSTIFKSAARDMKEELTVNGINNLRQTNPQQFARLVEQGVIDVSENGQPMLHSTLAEEALDKGLRGSIRNMANQTVGKTLESEARVQQITSTFRGTIDVSEPQFQKVLVKVAADYGDVGFGEIANDANYLLGKLKEGGGTLSGRDTLLMRRLFDKLRLASSFDRPATSLSLTQANMKTLADTLRSRLNKIPGMTPVMADYSFYLDALETLAKEATRRGNSQVIGLIDSIFIGGGLGSSNPVAPLTVGVLRRTALSGPATTGLGQAISNPFLGTAGSTALGVSSRGVQSLQTGQ